MRIATSVEHHELGVAEAEIAGTLSEAASAVEAGRYDLAKAAVDKALLACPTSAEAHFLAAKLDLVGSNVEAAVWHAFITLAYVDGEEAVGRVTREVLEPASQLASSSTVTDHLLKGVMAIVNKDLDLALQEFRRSLAESSLREERILALQFLVLTTGEMGVNEAALGYADELIAFDPNNYLAHLWRSDILAMMGRAKEADQDRREAERLLEEFERAGRMELGHAETAPLAETVVPAKGDLRAWLLESTSQLMAPIRAALSDQQSTWKLTVRLDDMFSNETLSDGTTLEEIVAKAVGEKRTKEPLPLPRAMRHPFAAEGSNPVMTAVVEKILASNACPAVVQLLDAEGKEVLPRLMWKKGDDLHRDLTAMVFFEIFNIIWSHTLGPDLFSPVLTYGILPLKGRVGFIEWIEDTVTQQDFKWQRGDPEVWASSFATSMTAAYCIGAEDRHSRNILVHESDEEMRVFQIDFGYIWGEIPGAGLGAGPALPFSNKVARAFSVAQKRRFRDYSTLLYQILAQYRSELARLAKSVAKNLEVPIIVNVKRFIKKRLGSLESFQKQIQDAESDRGRFRKEFLALAWSNKTFVPNEYFSKVAARSAVFDDSQLMHLVDRSGWKEQQEMKRKPSESALGKAVLFVPKTVGWAFRGVLKSFSSGESSKSEETATMTTTTDATMLKEEKKEEAQ